MPLQTDDRQQPSFPVPVLVSRLLALLDTCAHLTEQIPAATLHRRMPDRERTRLDLAYHVSQVVVAFLDAALGGRLTREHFERRPPGHLQEAADVARLTRSVSQAVAVWWGANRTRLPDAIDTFDGREPLDTTLERTVRHVARHARQLERILRDDGIEPSPGLPPALTADLGPLE